MFEIILTTGIHLFWNKPADQPAERYRWTNTVLVDPKGMKDINDGNIESMQVKVRYLISQSTRL